MHSYSLRVIAGISSGTDMSPGFRLADPGGRTRCGKSMSARMASVRNMRRERLSRARMNPGAEGQDRAVGSVNIASAGFMVAGKDRGWLAEIARHALSVPCSPRILAEPCHPGGNGSRRVPAPHPGGGGRSRRSGTARATPRGSPPQGGLQALREHDHAGTGRFLRRYRPRRPAPATPPPIAAARRHHPGTREPHATG
jgi:hypothetical protein